MTPKDLLHGARFLISETAHDRLPLAEREVAFVGRSNVGKSSLICALTNNWKLARVSKTPGQTRAINVFEVKKNRWIVDLPGYGYAVGPARERGYWPEMIGKYLGERSGLACAYVILDADVGPSDIDRSSLDWMADHNIPHKVILGKIDKVGGSRAHHRRLQIAAEIGRDPADLLPVSAKTNTGLSLVQQDVATALGF